MLDPARFRQPAHGFSKLTAVIVGSGGFRRCLPSETPHAIVARVYDADTFAVVTSGEIDGLTGISTGSIYGINASGDLAIGGVGTIAIGSRETSVLLTAGSSSSSGPTIDLSGYQTRAEKGAPNGYVPLGTDSLIDSVYLPDSIDEIARRRSWMGF